MKNFIISYYKNGVYQALIVKAETEEQAKEFFREYRETDVIGITEKEDITEEIKKGMPIIRQGEDMLRRDVADRLYEIVCHRFNKEQPNRTLTMQERDTIWYDIYGKLCHGESKKEVKKWCETVLLRKD